MYKTRTAISNIRLNWATIRICFEMSGVYRRRPTDKMMAVLYVCMYLRMYICMNECIEVLLKFFAN